MPDLFRPPALFVGHGSPMNALARTPWAEALRALGEALPPLHAVVAISAHWHLPRRLVGAAAQPRTIHDFSGFPPELSRMRYEPPGDPALAAEVAALVQADGLDPARGLDHGIWSVLVHLLPQARIPVVPLSLDARATPAQHRAWGEALRPLRARGVLLLATGSITHHLGALDPRPQAPVPAWARQTDERVAEAALAKDAAALAAALTAPEGRMAHPTDEHALPLWYALGAAEPEDPVSFPTTGFELGSLSMRSICFG